MIGRISGTLVEKRPPAVLVDTGGVGYEIDVPMSTFYELPPEGSQVTLLTHLLVREDAQLLYGFLSELERATFKQLIKISGVGARIALAILSGLSVTELRMAVNEQEPGRLTRVPGIGKKTAERLLLELKGKLDDLPGGASLPQSDNNASDIVHALLALGYSDKESRAAAARLPADANVADGIRLALKQLAK
ncbi:MAG: Holliday junction branch migration protein RuvA [Burkholderiaceae bacterium]